ncbi:GFA family protein [Tritonibacter sp. SIMBA_163]|uniref:GFA family protein n=1 Tax=Tritonibacter sp. SIMBA_163 TaxID=3080868 RepID=UPI00397ECACE
MKTLEGGCLCGRVRFRTTGPPEFPHTCSCRMCQRHTGTLTATWVEFPVEAVEWIGPGGKPALFRSSKKSSRAFCSTCGSTIGAVDDEPVVALLTGVFDKPHLKALKPETHSYKASRPKWWHPDVGP